MEKFMLLTNPELEELIYSCCKRALGEFKSDNKQVPHFLDLQQACEFLNLAPQTIYSMTSKREIPFIKKGKKLYFKKADLTLWLEMGRKFTNTEMSEKSKGLTFNSKDDKIL